MTWTCKTLQEALADHSRDFLETDEEALAHLETCDACFAVLEALDELDEAFTTLPALNPSTEVLEQTIEAVWHQQAVHPEQAARADVALDEIADEATGETPDAEAARSTKNAATSRKEVGPWYDPFVRFLSDHVIGAFTWARVAVVGVSAFLLTFAFVIPSRLVKLPESAPQIAAVRQEVVVPRSKMPLRQRKSDAFQASEEEAKVAMMPERPAGSDDKSEAAAGGFDARFSASRRGASKSLPAGASPDEGGGEYLQPAPPEEALLAGRLDVDESGNVGIGTTRPRKAIDVEHGRLGAGDTLHDSLANSGDANGSLAADETVALNEPPPPPPEKKAAYEMKEIVSDKSRPADLPATVAHRVSALPQPVVSRDTLAMKQRSKVPEIADEEPDADISSSVAMIEKRPSMFGDKTSSVPSFKQGGEKGKEVGPNSSERTRSATYRSIYDIDPDSAGLSASTRRFLEERTAVEGVAFREASGYWANTYVPGDPELRHLQSVVATQSFQETKRKYWPDAEMEARVRELEQPFDPPENSALAVYLNADRSNVSGPSRMLVQVGLRATDQQGGRRPSMNVGIVLDVPAHPDETLLTSYRALLEAFIKARDIGDRFSVTVAGVPGGTLIPPSDFRYGPVTILLEQLQEGHTASDATLRTRKPPETLSLPDAVASAMEVVRAVDDPSQPLGSSEVLVVTSRRFGTPEMVRLASIAHYNAVEGIPLSVVGIGQDVELPEIDRLVQAGQGNRRLMNTPTEAEDLVERELAAVSTVVARAIRLRIQLSPGVKLVDVIGSHRLGQADAQRVREAEQSVDQRLARNLGIQADRGEDEAGIQIVIPSFQAGDSHVVLLDVVAEGPGPVADVSVRYKDLANMQNGVARVGLSMPQLPSEPGRLEVNVLKNLLARTVSASLRAAADALSVERYEAAVATLGDTRTLLSELTTRVVGLASDRGFRADVLMLDDYLAALNQTSAQIQQVRVFLKNSMNYAGLLKILPHPRWN